MISISNSRWDSNSDSNSSRCDSGDRSSDCNVMVVIAMMNVIIEVLLVLLYHY
jgi:hypothetical protein